MDKLSLLAVGGCFDAGLVRINHPAAILIHRLAMTSMRSAGRLTGIMLAYIKA